MSEDQVEADVERVARAICVESGQDPDFDYDPRGVTKTDDVRWRLYVGKARAAIAAMGEQWRDISSAPIDGTPVLVKLKDRIPLDREDLRRWDGLSFVARSHGDIMGWGFAAPVGHGGFPDEWMEGWCPLPAPPVKA